MKKISDYLVSVSDEAIDKLHNKISLTRWPDEINDKKWSLGTSLNYLKGVSNYWKSDFDWRDHEAKLNEIGSFMYKTSDGNNIHFLHSKSRDPNAIPIIMTHGWPGSVQEFLKIIPLLNKGMDGISFNVVCPSMPGYGFSYKPSKLGTNSKEIAKIEHELMLELGYNQYIAQGGDWGSTVSKWMADLFKDNCVGLHLNLVLAFPPEGDNPMKDVSEEEIKAMKNFEKYNEKGFGYFAIQSTKPQTLGYALSDSPIGLAGWIIEKFHAWTNDDHDALVIPLDEVLAIISLYWFTNSITSSTRLYFENGQAGFSFDPVVQPTGCAIFEHEIVRPPKAWADKIYNITHWKNHPGGHFAALENPKLLAQDIIEFIKSSKISML